MVGKTWPAKFEDLIPNGQLLNLVMQISWTELALLFRHGYMFDELEQIFHRPKPFEHYTAKDLWTDDHTSKQMLKFHLTKKNSSKFKKD